MAKKAINIKWITEGEDPKVIENLPTEVELPQFPYDEDADIFGFVPNYEEAKDYLGETYHCCVEDLDIVDGEEKRESMYKCSNCGSENVNIVTSVNQLTKDVNYKYLHCEECGEDTELE